MTGPRRWAGRRVQRLRAAAVAIHGTTCCLCGQPIDLSLPWPDPMSLSVDHHRPKSKGGNDVVSNLLPAHLTCNTARGNRDTLPDRRPVRTGRFSTQPGRPEEPPTLVSPGVSTKNGAKQDDSAGYGPNWTGNPPIWDR